MNLLISRRRRVEFPAEFGGQRVQLAMDIAPLAQAQNRQKIFLAQLRQLACGVVFHRLVVPGPEFEPGGELGLLFRTEHHAPVRRIRRLLLLRWAQPRVLCTQCAGDNRQLGQAMVIPGSEHHAAEARIQRQSRQIAAQRRQLLSRVSCCNYGAQLLQQQQPITNRFVGRRLDERKPRHVTELQIQHAQDHVGQ